MPRRRSTQELKLRLMLRLNSRFLLCKTVVPLNHRHVSFQWAPVSPSSSSPLTEMFGEDSLHSAHIAADQCQLRQGNATHMTPLRQRFAVYTAECNWCSHFGGGKHERRRL